MTVLARTAWDGCGGDCGAEGERRDLMARDSHGYEDDSPSPCGRGLGEGIAVVPTPPPNPLPQGEGEQKAANCRRKPFIFRLNPARIAWR